MAAATVRECNWSVIQPGSSRRTANRYKVLTPHPTPRAMCTSSCPNFPNGRGRGGAGPRLGGGRATVMLNAAKMRFWQKAPACEHAPPRPAFPPAAARGGAEVWTPAARTPSPVAPRPGPLPGSRNTVAPFPLPRPSPPIRRAHATTAALLSTREEGSYLLLCTTADICHSSWAVSISAVIARTRTR